MRRTTETGRRTHRSKLHAAAVLTAAGLAAVAAAGPAYAATTGTGTTSAALTAGALAVTAVGTATTVSATVGGTGTGLLPSVTLQDTTGSGAGWNTTVGVSSLTFTGTWANVGTAPALTVATSGAFTDTVDGATYTVTIGAGGLVAGVGPYSWTSTDAADAAGGSGATTAGATNPTIGTKGVSINFGVQAIAAGSVYRLHVGTQATSALAVNTGVAGAGVTTTVGNAAPTLTGNGTTLTGGGPASTAYGTAVKIATAAVGNGMGTYVVTNGVSLSTDVTSWAATYSAGLQYSIVSGP